MRRILPLILLIFLISCKPRPLPVRKNLQGARALVVADHPEAVRIGKRVLKQGGNAIDAVTAVQFALAVSYPYAGNLGGGGFMVYRPAEGAPAALDFREVAPKAAFRDMYLDTEGAVIPGKSIYGQAAAGVPGSVDGILTAHAKYGTMPLEELIQPAIDLAEKGFPISLRQAFWFNKEAGNFRMYNRDPASVALLKPEGEWQAGEVLVQSDLAKTLERIRDQGRDGFYGGETARLIVEEMESNEGFISKEDLKTYASKWRQPLQSQWGEMNVITMPPPSAGGIVLIQMLKMTGQPEVLSRLKKYGHGHPESIHILAEAMRRAYADRSKHIADPDFVEVPQETLLSDAYLEKRWKNFSAERAGNSKDIGPGNPAPPEKEETTHISIVDPFGNAVSVTTTINGAYGSRTFVQGAGFLLNNEMDDFSAKPGVPNDYGLVGTEANAVAPGKKMLSSMTPTIVEKNGELFIVLGTPGGSTITTNVFQTLINVVVFDLSLPEAIQTGRFHHQWLPDQLFYEPEALSAEQILALEKKGHVVSERGSIGALNAIRVLSDGSLEGVADPRRDCTVGGF